MKRTALIAQAVLAAFAAAIAAAGVRAAVDEGTAPLPSTLDGTGLYLPGTQDVRPDILPFSPQYALWSDGAGKRRWISLPPGTSIDASDPDAWEFPPGTRLWKEFGYSRPVETRYIERLADGSWRYASYVWSADGTQASLAPARGIKALPAEDAPGGRYTIPSQDDCRACHEGNAVPVIGASALQLSPDRDPLAPRAETPGEEFLDLRRLQARGLLINLPVALLENPPRIAAATPTERAALGYLHANCGHCHNAGGELTAVDLVLFQSVQTDAPGVQASTIGRSSRFRADGMNQRIVPGDPQASVLAARMRTSNPYARMPPLGTRLPDAEGIALVERWIREDLKSSQEKLK